MSSVLCKPYTQISSLNWLTHGALKLYIIKSGHSDKVSVRQACDQVVPRSTSGPIHRVQWRHWVFYGGIGRSHVVEQVYMYCNRKIIVCVAPAGILGFVSPGAATEGCHPIFFLEKSDDLFSVIASESDDLFQLSSPHHSHLPTSFIQCSF